MVKRIARPRPKVTVATTLPAVTDDASKGYQYFSQWYNSTTGDLFTCLDPTTGSAVWRLDATIGQLAQAEPMGFPNITDTGIAWNDGTKTFTLSKTGADFYVWVKGTRYYFTADQVLVGDGTDFTIAEGQWFFYFDPTGTLVASQTIWDFGQGAPVAILYWDATGSAAIVFCDERHGLVMSWATHEYLHETEGTGFNNGLNLTALLDGDGDSDVHAQAAVSDGEVQDEDLHVTIVNGVGGGRFEQDLDPTAKIPVYYREGAAGVWRKKTTDGFPVYQGVLYGATRCGWNDPDAGGAGVWGITEVMVNRYTDTIICATNSYNEPVIAILGQSDYSSLLNARDADPLLTMDLTGLPVEEIRYLYRLIVQTKDSYANTVKARWRSPITDYRTASLGAPASETLPTDHQALSNRAAVGAHPASAVEADTTNFDGVLTDADDTVQKALETLDEADPSNLQVLYVGKHGIDTNDGKNSDRAFLTFGAAITAAGTPANEAAAVVIVCLDDGEYDEDLTCVDYVNIYAPNATLKGKQTLAVLHLTVRRMINDGDDGVILKATAGTAYVTAEAIYSSAASPAIAHVTGDIQMRAGRIENTGGRAISVGGGAGATLNVKAGEIISVSECLAMGGVNGPVTVNVGRMSGGTGIKLVGTGEMDAMVSNIACTTAYDINATSTLRLLVSELSGTETAADGADVRITKAKRDNYVATTDPTVDDDADDGYTVGSHWWNTSNDKWWICDDPSTGVAVWRRFANRYFTMSFTFLNNGAVLNTGVQEAAYLQVPCDCEIKNVRMYGGPSGSIVVDLWKDTYANYPPTVADTIVASAPPTISGGVKSEDTVLTDWTKTLSEGDGILPNIDSVTNMTWVKVVLLAERR